LRQIEVYKYNPCQSPPEELEATFVARHAILDSILNELRARARTPANQHFLLIGPRGIGKTNLLLMIRYGVLGDDALARAYLPLQTAEEEYSVTSLRDFFARILDLLQEHASDPQLETAADSLDAANDDYDAAELAIAAVKGFAERSGQKILLLADNLDLILGEQLSDDAQLGRLRDILMNDSFLVLVGAAATYFEEVSRYDRPFYNFFSVIGLDDLSAEQMGELLHKRAELDENRTILDHWEELQPRIKAVHHLTGGNPRLVLMLYQLCTASELPEVRAAVQALLDDVTPYYKSRLEQLPPQPRRVMDTFARLGRAATPTELAEETRLPVNQINSILRRLRDTGFVTVGRQERRKKTYYMVSERVFRIWHQMRFSAASHRLQFLIDFIRIWYTPQEWLEEVDRLLAGYRSRAAEKRFAEAGLFLEGLDYLAEGAPADEIRYMVVDETVRACIESGDYDHAEDILEDRRQRYGREQSAEQLARIWRLKGYLRFQQGRAEEAVDALQKALSLQPEFAQALYDWGTVLSDLALTKTGAEQEDLFQQACEKFQAALRIKPDMHEVLTSWGSALGDLARTKTGAEQEALLQRAIEMYEAGLRINPDDHWALNNLGVELDSLARAKSGPERDRLFEQAFEKYSAAIRIERGRHEALYNWSLGLHALALTKAAVEQDRLLEAASEKMIEAIEVASLLGHRQDAASYSGNLVHFILVRCANAIEQQHAGRARELFALALGRVPQAGDRLARDEFAGFFHYILSHCVLREEILILCSQFFEVMRERGMERELGVLEPFAKAVEYWQKDKDAEVLDRLNPEVREIIEEIIRKGEDTLSG